MSQNKLEGHEVFVELVNGTGEELPLSAEYVAQAVQDVLVVTGWKYGDPIPSDSLFMEEILENNPALITNQGARNILRTMFAYVSVLTKNLEFVAQVTDRQAGLSLLFDSQCRLKQSRLGIPRAIFPSIPHSFKLKGSDEPRSPFDDIVQYAVEVLLNGGKLESMISSIRQHTVEKGAGHLPPEVVIDGAIPKVAEKFAERYPLYQCRDKVRMVERMMQQLLFTEVTSRVKLLNTVIGGYSYLGFRSDLSANTDLNAFLLCIERDIREKYEIPEPAVNSTVEVSMKQDIEKASSGDLTPEQANQEADAAELRLHASQDPASEKSYPEADLRATPAEMRLNRVWLEFEKVALDAAIKGIPMTVLERVLIASAPEWIDSTQLTSIVNTAVELYAERLIRMPVFDEFTYAMFDEISLLDLAEKFNMDIREVRVKYADWKNHCDSWGNSKFNNLMLILIRI